MINFNIDGKKLKTMMRQTGKTNMSLSLLKVAMIRDTLKEANINFRKFLSLSKRNKKKVVVKHCGYGIWITSKELF